MFLLAHIGITLGAAVVVGSAVLNCRHFFRKRAPGLSPSALGGLSVPAKRSFSEIIGLNSLSEFLDFRFLVLGSLLPDIVDKPLAFLSFGGGRSIAHTMLITLVMLLIGLFLFLNYKKTRVLAVSFGMVAHLILDFMWVTPDVFFWPLYGWDFPGREYNPGFLQFSLWWSTLINNLAVAVYEGIGLIILLTAALFLVSRRKLAAFFITGKI